MALLLPEDYRHTALLRARGVMCLPDQKSSQQRLRVGIVNLMPGAQSYEPLLLSALGAGDSLVEPVWLRLDSHVYGSSDREQLLQSYATYSQASDKGRLHGMILTGAPVEELPFEQVRYWEELRALLERGRREVTSTLGLCWGGMALAKLLDVDKVLFPQKLFGNLEMRALASAGLDNLAGQGVLLCAQSRHAGIEDIVLERAAAEGRVKLLTHSQRTGYTVFESSDGRYLMHLGHPEYDRQRLVHEYQRDRSLGRGDVAAPEGVDLADGGAALRSHGPAMFARWLDRIALASE